MLRGGGRRHPVVGAVCWIVLAAAVVPLALRSLPAGVGDSTEVPELVSFTPWFAPLCLVPLVAAVLCRKRVLGVAAALALGGYLALYAGYLLPATTVSDAARAQVAAGRSTDDGVLRVMTLNASYGSADPDELVAAVRDNNVEVLCLQEVTNDYLDELDAAGMSELLPYCVVSDVGYVNNGGRNCVLTLAPTADESSDLLPVVTSSLVACSIEVGGVTLRFVSVHANSPHLGGEGWWAEGLATIGELAAYDHDYVICGDFNATWDHARFRAMLGDTFVDAGQQAGEGFHMTYPANSVLPALIEIDHVVYSAQAPIRVGDLDTLEVSGTDHLALLATVEVVG